MKIPLIALFCATLASPTPSLAQKHHKHPKTEPVGVFMNVSGYLCKTPQQAVGFKATRNKGCKQVTDESASWVDVIQVKGGQVGHLVIYNFEYDGNYEYMEVYAPLQELRMWKIPVVQEGTPV